MKVLWITNLPTPEIARCCGLKEQFGGGWLVYLSKLLSERDDIELSIAFPQDASKDIIHGVCEKIKYYGFFSRYERKIKEAKGLRTAIGSIIDKDAPDIIHIIGTEYVHSYIAIDEAEKKGRIDRCILTVQGLASECCKHYNDFLPMSVVMIPSANDLKRRNNLYKQAHAMKLRGKAEIKAIRKAKYITGRTTWDKECIKRINPAVKYYEINEILREDFYNKEWNYERCRKHSIFISQAQYPLKGFHVALKAIKKLTEVYPDVIVRVAGQNIIASEIGQMTSYGKYINDIIYSLGVSDNIQFVGELSSEGIVNELLNANVFVSASSIENSSNSVCEAMLVGTPVVSTNVGGIPTLIQDQHNGLTWKAGDERDLFRCLKSLFENNDISRRLSEKARIDAFKRHDIEHIIDNTVKLYKNVNLANNLR